MGNKIITTAARTKMNNTWGWGFEDTAGSSVFINRDSYVHPMPTIGGKTKLIVVNSTLLYAKIIYRSKKTPRIRIIDSFIDNGTLIINSSYICHTNCESGGQIIHTKMSGPLYYNSDPSSLLYIEGGLSNSYYDFPQIKGGIVYHIPSLTLKENYPIYVSNGLSLIDSSYKKKITDFSENKDIKIPFYKMIWFPSNKKSNKGIINVISERIIRFMEHKNTKNNIDAYPNLYLVPSAFLFPKSNRLFDPLIFGNNSYDRNCDFMEPSNNNIFHSENGILYIDLTIQDKATKEYLAEETSRKSISHKKLIFKLDEKSYVTVKRIEN